MVNSRTKGARGEYAVRDLLRLHTDLQFERIPASGALAYLKGDLYVPLRKNLYCIEVKSYKESPLDTTIFTALKTNNLIRWWKKLKQQAKAMEQEPLLFFKFNRSKIFVVTQEEPENTEMYMYISWLGCFIMLAEDWLDGEDLEFLGD